MYEKEFGKDFTQKLPGISRENDREVPGYQKKRVCDVLFFFGVNELLILMSGGITGNDRMLKFGIISGFFGHDVLSA